jgi:hypothetical protein
MDDEAAAHHPISGNSSDGTVGRASGFPCRIAGSAKRPDLGRLPMTAKLVVALVLLLGATSISLAQSQRNFGPNGPSRFNCYGEPYSGTIASRCPGEGGYGYYGHRYRHRY